MVYADYSRQLCSKSQLYSQNRLLRFSRINVKVIVKFIEKPKLKDYPDLYKIVPNQNASSSEPESLSELSEETSLVMLAVSVVSDSTSCFSWTVLGFLGLA